MVNELKILILKPSSLGDVIHAIPVLRLLKLRLPQSEIYWWLDAGLTPLLENDPDLAGVIPFHRKRWKNPRYWHEVVESVQAMRKMHFDWAIDLQGLARSAIAGWLANADIFFGLDNLREGGREGARGFYDLFPPRSPEGAHAVDRYLTILSLLKVPIHWNFDWLAQSPSAAASVRQRWNPDLTRWIVLLPGARWENKRWPVEYFRDVIRRLSKTPNVRFVVLGSADDRALGQAIADASPDHCLDLTGKTSLQEMIEWIRLSSLVISNDTGPMHAAAALRKPVIALFGPTDPCSTGPYCQLDNVIQTGRLPCVPCLKPTCRHREPLACLHAITPAMVCEKAVEKLKFNSDEFR